MLRLHKLTTRDLHQRTKKIDLKNFKISTFVMDKKDKHKCCYAAMLALFITNALILILWSIT